MPSHAPRSLAAALVFVLAITLAACATISRSPRTWTETAELAAGGTTTIEVRDASGRIDDVQFDPPAVDPVPDTVANPPGQPNVLLVSWTGGACDERTDVDIAGAGAGLAISIRTTVAQRDCDAIGIGRTLLLTSSQPLPANLVTVTTGR